MAKATMLDPQSSEAPDTVKLADAVVRKLDWVPLRVDVKHLWGDRYRINCWKADSNKGEMGFLNTGTIAHSEIVRG